jgi:hypothetical protein
MYGATPPFPHVFVMRCLIKDKDTLTGILWHPQIKHSNTGCKKCVITNASVQLLSASLPGFHVRLSTPFPTPAAWDPKGLYYSGRIYHVIHINKIIWFYILECKTNSMHCC